MFAGRTSRRDFLKLAGLAGAGFAAGCGGGEKTVLRLSAPVSGPGEKGVLRGLAGAVPEVYEVELETRSPDDYWEGLTEAVINETTADIVGIDSSHMPLFADGGAFRPLRPFVSDAADFEDFFATARSSLSFDGEVYALPYDVGTLVLVYNQDLFDEAGARAPRPEESMSWETFRETAAELTNVEAGSYGFAMRPVFDRAVPWLWSGGGDYMDVEERRCTLTSPESVAALEFVAGTFAEFGAPVTDPADPLSAAESFCGGSVGMLVEDPRRFAYIRENAGFEWGIAPLPAGPAGSVTWAAASGFGVSSATKRAGDAWRALEALTGVGPLERNSESGLVYPGRESAASAFAQSLPESVDVVRRVLGGEISEARPFRTTTTWTEISVVIARDLDPVFLGERSVQEAVEKVRPQFDTYLAEHQEILGNL